MLNFAKRSHWAVLGVLSGVYAANVVFDGASVQLDGIYYFIDPHVTGELPLPRIDLAAVTAGGFMPVTVVQSTAEATSLDSLLQSWLERDDVFQPSFLWGGVYVADGRFLSESSQHAPSSMKLLNTTALVQHLPPNTTTTTRQLPSGPYFLHAQTGKVHRALRLYDDYADAFTGSLLQSTDGGGRVQTLSAQIPTAMTLTMGVPSRLYYTVTAAQPLAGVRLGVKDLFCVRGARRSNANRAWYHLYDLPCDASATAVQRLVDAGAVVVGYQMLAQFALGDRYTSDAVDMHLPFNPRGDGYASPEGSSSGGAASVAAYPWMDLALGTDTGGSVRGPAQVIGVFGNRPTEGLVSLEGVTPLSPGLDTPGLLTRDPALWDTAQQVLYGEGYKSLAGVKAPEYPKTVYLLNWPKGKGYDVDGMLDGFVNAVVEVTGAKVETIDLEALWARTRPSEVGDVTLAVFLNSTYTVLTATDQWNLVGKPFFADYAKKHGGRKPFVNPSPLTRWTWAQTLPASAYPAARRQHVVARAWFGTHVLAATGNARCSSALLLYSDYLGTPNPRTTMRVMPGVRGLQAAYWAPLTGTPDLALPLGEVRTLSNVTGEAEPLPVSADIMAARGCDGLLTRLAAELVAKGAVKVPQTGASLNGGAEMLFRQ
ncbi:Amidase [Cordyceps militaris CM01]|uniref:Amidase n=1 Tax=Cordyceps militaris (strain CM01) TaxID=983644 RepID=G3JBS0_CORMM|nr:Amidase [Cordyceps militaris CM01]EGX94493.1 Amidase [Cordyceps militaris CM01]